MKTNHKLILGIETSCDDTSICLLKGQVFKNQINYKNPEVISLEQFSQTKILEKWGGVVPEIAARNHLVKLPLLIKYVLEETQIDIKDIDLLAVTTHPGLLGPLLTGLNISKSISLIFKKPIFPTNHLYAHLEAIHLTEKIEYPYLGLLVSGGHSLYALVKSPTDFTLLGSTIDDAAGEAFDKGGKLLKLSYPAGPLIDKYAKLGNKQKYTFPIGLQSSKNSTLSFSGTKTSLRVFLDNHPDFLFDPDQIDKNKSYTQNFYNLCASYQFSIVSALKLKLKYAISQALEITKGKKIPIVVGGGVAANSCLREVIKNNFNDVHFVKPKYCTDNAAMIANYALRNYDDKVSFPDCLKLDAKNRFINKTKSS
jgi:N6-L-threonylcarbamoyladenine synthase